jgi:hypothetical protein
MCSFLNGHINHLDIIVFTIVIANKWISQSRKTTSGWEEISIASS